MIPVSMKPNTAAPVAIPRWEEKQAGSGKRLRVTVLLDATPIDPAAVKLRAWDRAFLLDSLSSLASPASVRIRASGRLQPRSTARGFPAGSIRWARFPQTFTGAARRRAGNCCLSSSRAATGLVGTAGEPREWRGERKRTPGCGDFSGTSNAHHAASSGRAVDRSHSPEGLNFSTSNTFRRRVTIIPIPFTI